MPVSKARITPKGAPHLRRNASQSLKVNNPVSNCLYDVLFGRTKASDAPFLHFPDGTVLSYADFISLGNSLAATLVANGINPGDRVAAQVAKSSTALALYAACLHVGAVYLPLNTAYTDTEVAYFLADCTASLFFCVPARASQLESVARQAGASLLTMNKDGTGSWQMGETGATPPIAERSGQDLAAILYTSGTTGRPKGAMLSHMNLLSNAQTLADLWGVTNDDILLHALPVYHSHGLFVASNVMLLRGAQMIYLPKFDTDVVIEKLPDATMMMGVPTFYTRLLASPAFTPEISQHMRLFISGSAPLLAQTHRAFEMRTGHVILERYGLTETSMNTSNPLMGARKPGTVGRALPGVSLRIALGDKESVGEIEVKGPNVFQGYWGLDQQTTDAFTHDGYFRTGDLASMDSDGYVTIVGRSKDLIISGGLNIYPKDVEQVIDAQPGVLESAVIGLPDDDFGERVVAVVVPEPNITLDLAALKEALIGTIAKFKQPKEFELLSSLPRNAMGKVQKNILRDHMGHLNSGESGSG
jgi:malonyl-CoA/methylmalonyl-CoA synthetase